MSEPYRYTRNMYWSEIDQAFIVEVPELPGCMADRKTPAIAIANSEIAIREWLETQMECK